MPALPAGDALDDLAPGAPVIVPVVIDQYVALGGYWYVEAVVTVSGELSSVIVDEAAGVVDGHAQWLPGEVFVRRLGPVEQRALEQRLLQAARRMPGCSRREIAK